jgi:pSer/pThr/pTyr-binding forkhead associated (FHA) protein
MCKTGQLAGKDYIIKQEDATIGKLPSNHFVLDADIISGRHAHIFYDANEQAYFLEDLNSRNGTKLDGVSVTQKERLGKLHVITFAKKYDFIFQVLGEKAAASTSSKVVSRDEKTRIDNQMVATPTGLGTDAEKTMIEQEPLFAPSKLGEHSETEKTRFDQEAIVAPNLAGEVTAATKGGKKGIFHLEIKGISKHFPLKEGDNVVGRTEECDICIDDSSISRRHAILTVKSGTVRLKDLGSKNKTFLNNQKVEAEIEAAPNAAIRFGAVEAMLIAK